MKKAFSSCALIAGLSLVFGFSAAPVDAARPSNPASFQNLHQDAEEPAATISDPAAFLKGFEAELKDPKNATYHYVILEKRLKQYHQACQKFPGNGHFMMADYLLDCYQASRLDAAVVPMITAQFLKLGSLPVTQPANARLLLLAAHDMSNVKGPIDLDNPARKRDVLIRVMYRVRALPGVDPELAKIAAGAIAKDYFSATFGQALEELRKSLAEALKIAR